MKNTILILLLMSLFTTNCSNDIEYKEDTNLVSDTIFNFDNLKIYNFKPFSFKQLKTYSYQEKLELRQVPTSFLKQMTPKALFAQFVRMDMAKDVLLFNSPQAGIEHVKNNFNVVQELLNREDSHMFFIESLRNINLNQIQDNEHRFYFYCLTMFAAQKKNISKLNKKETIVMIEIIDDLMTTQSKLSNTKPDFWGNTFDYSSYMLMYANIMIINEFSDFTSLLESNENLSNFVLTGILNMPEMKIISEQIASFYKQLKNK